MTRLGTALCGLLMMGATAAQALDLPAATSAGASPVHAVQYGGPMDDGPGYGGPGYGGPGYGGPGYGGPGYGGPGYGMPPGMGPGYGMAGRGRARDSAGPHRYVSYHGFRIDIAGLGGMDPASAIRSVEHQIDIVDHVGMSPSMLGLFRSLPIRVSASFANASHYAGGNEVVLGGGEVNDNRPVLLHEYMHVLHVRRMPGGFRNPTILHFFEEARSRGLYEQGSYMLSNQGEFFAMTASCFLNGSVARAPYTREAIRAAQPDYYAYLEHLFGRGGVASAAAPRPLALAAH